MLLCKTSLIFPGKTPMDTLSSSFHMPDLVKMWLKSFGETPITTRQVIEASFIDHDIQITLNSTVPNFALRPQPRTVTKWLTRCENMPIESSGKTWRFARLGHRWRLILIAEKIAA